MAKSKLTLKAAKSLSEEAIELLNRELGKKFDVTFLYSGGVLGYNKLNMKIEVNAKDEDGDVVTTEEANFIECAAAYTNGKVKSKDLHKVFTIKREKFKLIGLNPRAKKYPFIVEKVSTKESLRMAVSYLLTAVEFK